MPCNHNRKQCNHSRSLASTRYFDILFDCKVIFSAFNLAYFVFLLVFLSRCIDFFVAFFLTNHRAKQFGPILKFVLCVGVSVPLILWPVVAIGGSILGGAAYGFLAPLMATFDAVGEGKTNDFIHCLYVWLRFPVRLF